MRAGRTLLFNHIPKTGGITLRVILNRVYGTDKVFQINSTNIKSSLDAFRVLGESQRSQYAVLSGHGAEFLRPFTRDPFLITILREPIAQFFSQYHFLRTSPGTNFLKEVSELGSFEAYFDYAVQTGQDNLLTRYLSHSIQYLYDPVHPVPDMKDMGDELFGRACQALQQYDAILDLERFDAGIFALSEMLGWRRIPIYRPVNVNRNKPALATIPEHTWDRLANLLKYDLELYRKFLSEKRGLDHKTDQQSQRYHIFSMRQKGVKIVAGILGKR